MAKNRGGDLERKLVAFALLACTAVLLSGGSTLAQEEASGASRPDVVLIVADDMAEVLCPKGLI